MTSRNQTNREVQMDTTAPRRIIGSKELNELVPKSRVQRWRDIKAGKFPAPIEIGPNKLGWYEDEIDAWLARRPRRTYGAAG
jgi:prophage regulatory protein